MTIIPQSPIPNPQSPIPNPQSPIPSPQSPVPIFRKVKGSLCLIICSFCLVIVNSVDNLAFSQNLSVSKDKQKSVCPEQNLESLTTYLLRDLPSYSNRVTQRARRRSRSSEVYSYILLAGRPEFTPLPLNPGIDTAEAAKSAASGVDQVFFTTLERQYLGGKAVELQEFHWLLLTKTQNGWRLVMMFTQSGSSFQRQPISPPRDSSNSAIAQAINIWLRDCQAGSMRMGVVKKNDRILPEKSDILFRPFDLQHNLCVHGRLPTNKGGWKVRFLITESML